jgi:hypothetical protein
MHSLFITLWRPLRAIGTLLLPSGESTTEQKLSALLLALRSVKNSLDEINFEDRQLAAAIKSGGKINSKDFPRITRRRRYLSAALHFTEKAAKIVDSLGEITEKDGEKGRECVVIVEALAETVCKFCGHIRPQERSNVISMGTTLNGLQNCLSTKLALAA